MTPIDCTGAQRYSYESVPGDPMQTMYSMKLKNGLKIIFGPSTRRSHVYRTYIAVRTELMQRPEGLRVRCHHLEHLMFKGTTLRYTECRG